MMAEQESAMEYDEHNKTYALFVAMVKYGVITVLIILALMAFFLV